MLCGFRGHSLELAGQCLWQGRSAPCTKRWLALQAGNDGFDPTDVSAPEACTDPHRIDVIALCEEGADGGCNVIVAVRLRARHRHRPSFVCLLQLNQQTNDCLAPPLTGRSGKNVGKGSGTSCTFS